MPHKLSDALINIRRMIAEPSPSVWSDADLIAFYQEGLNRIKGGTKYLSGLRIPTDPNSIDELVNSTNISDEFVTLPDLFAAARAFDQDKQYFDSSQKMNEFETKRLEYIDWVEEDYTNRAIIPAGMALTDPTFDPDYVTDNYSDGKYAGVDEEYVIPVNE